MTIDGVGENINPFLILNNQVKSCIIY